MSSPGVTSKSLILLDNMCIFVREGCVGGREGGGGPSIRKSGNESETSGGLCPCVHGCQHPLQT